MSFSIKTIFESCDFDVDDSGNIIFAVDETTSLDEIKIIASSHDISIDVIVNNTIFTINRSTSEDEIKNIAQNDNIKKKSLKISEDGTNLLLTNPYHRPLALKDNYGYLQLLQLKAYSILSPLINNTVDGELNEKGLVICLDTTMQFFPSQEQISWALKQLFPSPDSPFEIQDNAIIFKPSQFSSFELFFPHINVANNVRQQAHDIVNNVIRSLQSNGEKKGFIATFNNNPELNRFLHAADILGVRLASQKLSAAATSINITNQDCSKLTSNIKIVEFDLKTFHQTHIYHTMNSNIEINQPLALMPNGTIQIPLKNTAKKDNFAKYLKNEFNFESTTHNDDINDRSLYLTVKDFIFLTKLDQQPFCNNDSNIKSFCDDLKNKRQQLKEQVCIKLRDNLFDKDNRLKEHARSFVSAPAKKKKNMIELAFQSFDYTYHYSHALQLLLFNSTKNKKEKSLSLTRKQFHKIFPDISFDETVKTIHSQPKQGNSNHISNKEYPNHSTATFNSQTTVRYRPSNSDNTPRIFPNNNGFEDSVFSSSSSKSVTSHNNNNLHNTEQFTASNTNLNASTSLNLRKPSDTTTSQFFFNDADLVLSPDQTPSSASNQNNNNFHPPMDNNPLNENHNPPNSSSSKSSITHNNNMNDPNFSAHSNFTSQTSNSLKPKNHIAEPSSKKNNANDTEHSSYSNVAAETSTLLNSGNHFIKNSTKINVFNEDSASQVFPNYKSPASDQNHHNIDNNKQPMISNITLPKSTESNDNNNFNSDIHNNDFDDSRHSLLPSNSSLINKNTNNNRRSTHPNSHKNPISLRSDTHDSDATPFPNVFLPSSHNYISSMNNQNSNSDAHHFVQNQDIVFNTLETNSPQVSVEIIEQRKVIFNAWVNEKKYPASGWGINGNPNVNEVFIHNEGSFTYNAEAHSTRAKGNNCKPAIFNVMLDTLTQPNQLQGIIEVYAINPNVTDVANAFKAAIKKNLVPYILGDCSLTQQEILTKLAEIDANTVNEYEKLAGDVLTNNNIPQWQKKKLTDAIGDNPAPQQQNKQSDIQPEHSPAVPSLAF